MKIGSAPISWDVLSFGGSKTSGLSFAQMLDGIAAAGYEGTEISTNGFFPAERRVLARRTGRRGT